MEQDGVQQTACGPASSDGLSAACCKLPPSDRGASLLRGSKGSGHGASQLTTPLTHLGASLDQALLIYVPRPTLGLLCGLKQAT